MPPRVSQAHKSELFQGHLQLARSHAHKIAKFYGLPHEQTEDDAISILAVVCAEWDSKQSSHRYDSTKCNATHWIYQRVWWGLLDSVRTGKRRSWEAPFTDTRKERKDTTPYWDQTRLQPHLDNYNVLGNIPAPPSWLEKFCSDLGEDAKIVVNTILHGPAEVIEEIGKKGGRARRVVRRHFKQQGWPLQRIEKAWGEIAQCL